MGITMLQEGDDDVDVDDDDVETEEAEGWGGVSCWVTRSWSFCFFLFFRSRGFLVSNLFSSHTPVKMVKNKAKNNVYFLDLETRKCQIAKKKTAGFSN